MMKSKLVLGVLFLGFLGACNSGTSETSEAAEEVAHVEYACPMECEGDKTYEEAGKCPVCKMDLAEVSSDAVD